MGISKIEKETTDKFDQEVSDKMVEAVVDHFGITEDFAEAGYILPDGRLLDLSGKNQGGSGGYRALDPP